MKEWVREHRIILAILGGALLYRCFALTGDMLFDPVVYAQNAFNLLEGTFTLDTTAWFSHRLTVFLPVAPLYAAFGVHPWTSKLWPLLCSMAQLGLAAALGLRLFERRVVWVGLVLAALAPLDVVYATVLNPDIVISTFLTAAVVCWILGYESPHPRRVLLFASGVCLALAIVTRLFGVILVPFYLLWILWKRPAWRDLWPGVLWGAAGVLAVLVPLALVYLWQTGDAAYRLGVVSGRYGEGAKSEGTRFWYYPSLLLHPRFTITGLAPAAFGLGVLGALVRPNRPRWILLAWGLPILLYLQFGSMSTHAYIPILKRERFLLPLTIPLCLLAASISVAAVRCLTRGRRRLTGVVLGLGLLGYAAGSWIVVDRERALGAWRARAFGDVVAVLEAEPDRPVLFDHWRTRYRFSYYFGFREGADFYRGGTDADRIRRPGGFGGSRLGYLAWYPRADLLPPCFVVLDDDVSRQIEAGDSITGTYRSGDVPAYASPPPPGWQRIGRYGTFEVYRVG
ncbi:MAG: glycosyltransferase family 39 protein [Candidatus Eisenbacteria bacterium]|uniref:Glycosyltransferase family 39 protein n=1 Tax=Eiseniibacteriota bacterium TaxID=2212470 RepID=A0A956M0R1_UNCEI|nr:glycosyltransferase family 39 protein [Candidatus Eisenbacteria bacterium]